MSESPVRVLFRCANPKHRGNTKHHEAKTHNNDLFVPIRTTGRRCYDPKLYAKCHTPLKDDMIGQSLLSYHTESITCPCNLRGTRTSQALDRMWRAWAGWWGWACADLIGQLSRCRPVACADLVSQLSQCQRVPELSDAPWCRRPIAYTGTTTIPVIIIHNRHKYNTHTYHI